MKTLILRDVVKNSSPGSEGITLFNHLKDAYCNNYVILLEVDSDLSLSSSFLNSSIATFLDNYGYDSFKRTMKFKGSKTQFERLNKYIQEYKDLYLA